MNDEMVTIINGDNLSGFCNYSAFIVPVYFAILEIKFIQRKYFLDKFLLFCYNNTNIFYHQIFCWQILRETQLNTWSNYNIN